MTERIALGTSVVILPYRSPIPVAKLLASVDVLSGGRLIVGVAIGWLDAAGRWVRLDPSPPRETTTRRIRVGTAP